MDLVEALDRRRARSTTNFIKLRQFKVLSVQSGPPPSVTVDDRDEPVSEVRYLDSYTNPSAGDTVWALVDSDADILILGRLQS